MFNLDKSEMIESSVSRYLAILETDVTVTKEKIAEINALVEDGSELAMSEAKRLCEEELSRIEESGLCPMGKYSVYAWEMVDAANERIMSRGQGQTMTNSKALMEEIASQIPSPVGHMFVLGMFVGRIIADFEFRAMQMAAMKQAQDMLGGMGLGGVLGALGGAVGGAVPSPKSLLDRLKHMGEGGEDDN